MTSGDGTGAWPPMAGQGQPPEAGGQPPTVPPNPQPVAPGYPQPAPGVAYPQPVTGYPYPPQPASGVPYPQPASGVPYPQPASGVPYAQPTTGFPYGQPGPGAPYAAYPYPFLAPAPRRRWGRRLAGVLAVLLVCSVVGIGALVGWADATGALDVRATWQSPSGQPEPPPSLNAPAAEWDGWARRSVDDTVANQAKALLANDEAGYLAPADPGNARLLADLKRRFKVLRAMRPGVWTQTVSGGLTSRGVRTWETDIKISYCFGDASCQSVQLLVGSTWSVKQNRLALVALAHSEASLNGPRPWEIDDLSVKTGKRVVVAASKVNAWRLADAVTFADRAAAVADKFSKWEEPPNRYVIFLAGPNDWKEWYGHAQPAWAAAWAVPVSRTVTEVVVRTQVVQQVELQQLLTHELIHVTSLAGKRDGADRAAWWLIEGIAEYGSLQEQPVREYEALTPTRSFVRGDWDGDPAVSAPSTSASVAEASARYGVAYLAVRRIAEKYGQDKMLAFFGRVVHDGESVEAAAPATLGVSWATVKADAARYVRNSVG
ncbi:MAG TPA: hypothetical protein VF163_07840 [Micromonosporaceae bacterium]